MKKFTGFKPKNKGAHVYDIIYGNGYIDKIVSGNEYPVKVIFKSEDEETYTLQGLFSLNDNVRRLYFGHDLKVEVTGEKIPEPKLICPVCGVEHKIIQMLDVDELYYFKNPGGECPFRYSRFDIKDQAKASIETLIEIMETK